MHSAPEKEFFFEVQAPSQGIKVSQQLKIILKRMTEHSDNMVTLAAWHF